MSLGDDVVVGDIMYVGKGAPDFTGHVGIEGHLVTRVPPWRPGFRIPPDPGLAGIGGSGHADVGIADVLPIGLEGIDVVMPGGGHDQSVAKPGRTGPGLLVGRRIGVSTEPVLCRHCA